MALQKNLIMRLVTFPQSWLPAAWARQVARRLSCVLTLAGAVAGIAASTLHASDLFDIVPLDWITGTGCDCDEELSVGDAKDAVVFPSRKADMGIPATGARSEVKDFLLKDNRIPAVTLGYPLPKSPAQKIEVLRPAAKEGKLIITASAATVREIRKLSWKEFRSLQHEFACWLIQQNQPKYLLDRLDKPIEGFADPFEEKLRDFWRKVVETAGFEKFAAEQSVKSQYFPTLLIRPRNAAEATPGRQMGAIPLRPGMRLAIHWGGTAVYSYRKANVTRPTVTGVSYVSIGGAAAPMLDVAGGLTDKSPYVGLDSGGVIEDVFPYGVDNKFTLKIAPVYNEFDLNNSVALKPGAPSELILFTPISYVKADHLGDGTTTPKSPTYATHDGIAVGDEGTDKYPKSFSYKFILWGGKHVIADQKALDELDINLKDPLAFDHRPLVFGNQTWVEVEMPVSMNGVATHWLRAGTRLSAFLMDHASFLLFESPTSTSEPVARFMRARLQRPGESSPRRAEFRFWMPIPETWGSSVQLLPSDSFLFKP